MPSTYTRLVAGLMLISLATLLGACGGGGGGGGAAAPSFIAWTDNKNLTVVMTSNSQVQFLSSGNLYFNGQENSGIRLASTTSASVLLNGTAWANVVTVGGIAYLQCVGSSGIATVSSAGGSCTGGVGPGAGTISSPAGSPLDGSGGGSSAGDSGDSGM